MAIIFVAHGLTGSGKTETANYLEEKYGIYHFHPIGFAKRQYERLLQKPNGFLDEQGGKSFPIPGKEDHTMQDFMIGLYHFMREWMPLYSTLNMAIEVPRMLAYGNVCAVSIRNPSEVTELIRIRDEGYHRLVLLSLHRETARRETSDEYYQFIREKLTQHCNHIFPVNNNYNIKHLHNCLDDIIQFCRRNP